MLPAPPRARPVVQIDLSAPGRPSARHCHVDITANAFLHHMVRNVVGSLLAVGTAARSVGWFEEVLASRDRTLAAETSPADGLYLARVDYPDTFGLPPTPEGPTLLTGHL